jgi:hypothetical protein
MSLPNQIMCQTSQLKLTSVSQDTAPHTKHHAEIGQPPQAPTCCCPEQEWSQCDLNSVFLSPGSGDIILFKSTNHTLHSNGPASRESDFVTFASCLHTVKYIRSSDAYVLSISTDWEACWPGDVILLPVLISSDNQSRLVLRPTCKHLSIPQVQI